MSETAVKRYRDKAFILIMLASGRMFKILRRLRPGVMLEIVKVPVFHKVFTCSVLGRVTLKNSDFS